MSHTGSSLILSVCHTTSFSMDHFVQFQTVDRVGIVSSSSLGSRTCISIAIIRRIVGCCRVTITIFIGRCCSCRVTVSVIHPRSIASSVVRCRVEGRTTRSTPGRRRKTRISRPNRRSSSCASWSCRTLHGIVGSVFRTRRCVGTYRSSSIHTPSSSSSFGSAHVVTSGPIGMIGSTTKAVGRGFPRRRRPISPDTGSSTGFSLVVGK
mmetsp:Transcript_30979/g.72741  ORF Transcript_30979/g.72741 Transcript_30979/m.72741 type:complete len:208 (-) Transcript_30979:496-1119(-)